MSAHSDGVYDYVEEGLPLKTLAAFSNVLSRRRSFDPAKPFVPRVSTILGSLDPSTQLDDTGLQGSTLFGLRRTAKKASFSWSRSGFGTFGLSDPDNRGLLIRRLFRIRLLSRHMAACFSLSSLLVSTLTTRIGVSCRRNALACDSLAMTIPLPPAAHLGVQPVPYASSVGKRLRNEQFGVVVSGVRDINNVSPEEFQVWVRFRSRSLPVWRPDPKPLALFRHPESNSSFTNMALSSSRTSI